MRCVYRGAQLKSSRKFRFKSSSILSQYISVICDRPDLSLSGTESYHCESDERKQSMSGLLSLEERS